MAKKVLNEDIEVNNHIIDIISPMGVEFQKNYIMLGDVFCKVLTITNYPTNVTNSWEAKLCNIEGIIYKTAHTKIDPTSLIEHINNSIKVHRGRMLASKEAIVQERSKKAIEDFEKLLRKIDQEQEAIFNKSILIMVTGNSKEDLDKKVSRVTGKISAMGMKVKPLTFKQKEGLQSIAPFNFISEEIREKVERNMPVSTISGGFPFASSGLNDGKGTLLGEDITRGGVIVDIWKREGDRTNSNFTVLGNPGVGKSATVKKIMYNEWLQGTKIIVVDPEREYKNFCKNLGGAWVNLGGGKGGRINPLEVKPIPEDDEDEDDRFVKNKNTQGALALHFQTLRTFFKLYIPSLTDIQLARLEEVLELTYKKYGIDFDTDTSEVEKYPTLDDMWEIANQKSDEYELSKGKYEINDYKTIVSLIRSMCIGSDKRLWNGETNVDVDSDFICIDTHDLQSGDEKIQRSQYFNIMTWIWDKVAQNRDEKILVIFDEAYLVVDPKVPEALIYLRNYSKRIRKYEGGLGVISHSVVDFLHEEIRRYGQALMDNPTYKFMMGTDGKNLQELANLYDLTEAEQELLNAKRRGHVLLTVGNKRVHGIVKLEPHEVKNFGKGGGR